MYLIEHFASYQHQIVCSVKSKVTFTSRVNAFESGVFVLLAGQTAKASSSSIMNSNICHSAAAQVDLV